LGPGQTDVFIVDVAAGQFLHVAVEKKGVDVVLVVQDTSGKTLVTTNRPNGAFGPESASFAGNQSGTYQVRIVKSPQTTETGYYRIELTDLRSPSEKDLARIQAEKEFFAAVEEERAQSKESRRRALDRFRAAASLWHALQDDSEEASCLLRIGILSSMLGENEKALDYFREAIKLEQAGPDRAAEASTLNDMGIAYWLLGEKHKALTQYRLALPLRRSVGDRDGEAIVLNNMGLLYSGLGENQKALESYGQALPLYRGAGDRVGEAKALSNMGKIYYGLGEQQKALEYYGQSLLLRRALKDSPGEAIALNNIGAAYFELGEKQKALEYYEQALPLYRAAGNRDGEAVTLDNIGESYSELGKKQKALEYFVQALRLKRAVKDPAGEAETLNHIGEIYADLGERRKALQQYVTALRLAQAVSDPSLQALVMSGLMRYWELGHNVGLAIFFGKQAINEYQGLRRNIQGLDQELQKSYLKTVATNYRRLADLLIAQSRLAEAEQVLSLLKEQEYFDYVRRDAAEASPGGSNLTPDEAECDRRYREIADRLLAIGAERGDLVAKQTLTAEETRRLDQLERDVAVGNMEFEKFLNNLALHLNVKPAAALRVEQLRETQGIMEDLRELPVGTVAIYTLVGEDKFRAILRTADAQKAYEYPIKAADLDRKVLEFRQVVQDPKLDPQPLAQELYRIVIGPMAEDLRQARAQTLMWSLDGVLRYLPFAALYDGKQYLIEQYRLSVITLASNSRLKDRPDLKWKAAGFGVTRAHEGAAALPSVSSELASIIATKPGDSGVLAGEIKLDDEFTQQAMRQTLLKHYPVVHIASHFQFQPGNETQSFLLLGDGSHMSLADLKTSANLFGGVQLLTLSACNTGMGDGAEVEGFGTLAQRQGAKSVIASLWPVADESTSRLMQEFYRIRQSSAGKTKLEALQEAQLELLRGVVKAEPAAAADRALIHEEETGVTKSQAPRSPYNAKIPFAHPYYWAPFFLMGNWL
jgi:CHAT domain-containing protein/Tfp pilus assembly protein PilF